MDDISHTITAAASSSSLATAEKFLAEIVAPTQAVVVQCKAYGSYDELVRDPNVDIIYISSPHSHHFQNCMLALNAGKAVLCEKPITVNAEQAAVLYKTAKEKNVFLMEAVWTRFFPLSIYVRKLITDGVIGDVLRVFVNNSTGTEVSSLDQSHRYLNKSLAGGALLDIGVYALTWLFQTLYHTQNPSTRRPPSNLSSLVELHKPSGTDQMVSLILRFHMESNHTSKAHGMATTSMILTDAHKDPGYEGPTVHIYGLKGEIQVWGPAHRAQKIKVIPKAGEREPFEKSFPIPAGGHGMFWEADAAARCWNSGSLECETISWEESVQVMKVVDDIRRQADLIYPEEIETTVYPTNLAPRVAKR